MEPSPVRGGLRGALLEGRGRRGIGLIGEFKRCSPGGFIAYRDPYAYAEEIGGCVDAFSVLTEPTWFCGSPELIPVFSARRPVLFKDFVACREMVDAAALYGASAVLLILDMLGWGVLEELYEYARGLGLEALIEASCSRDAVEAANTYPEALIGLNARSLETLRVDFEAMLRELRAARSRSPTGTVLVAESGVRGPGDVARAAAAGADAVLVGTSLMRSPGWACAAAPSRGPRGSS